MDWSSLYDLVSDAVKIPLVAAVGGGLIGGGAGSICTHYFTQKREHKKLLREKAEAFIFILSQSQHRLTSWYLAMEHQAEHATPALVEHPTAMLLDLAQAYALQRLYFPAVDLQALEHALIPLVKWLETQWDQQHRDFHRWRAEFRREKGISLNDTYSTVYEETIEAVVRATPQSRKFARALARFRRHR